MRFFRELFFALFLGVIPASIILITEGQSGLHAFVTSLAPTHKLRGYFIILMVMQILFFIHIKYCMPKSNRNWRDSIYRFINELGFTLLGVFRCLAGAMVVTSLATLPDVNGLVFYKLLAKAIAIFILLLCLSTIASKLNESISP